MGTVTQANMRLSAVDGTAFVDFSAASVLTDYLNHLLVVKDSAGRVIQGYIKAAGTGETFGDELVTNGSFDSNTTGWTPQSCTLASIVGGQSGNCLEITRTGAAFQFAQGGLSTVVGRLYKMSGWVKSGTSGNESFRIGIYVASYEIEATGTSSPSWTYYEKFGVVSGTTPVFILQKLTATAGTMLFDTVSFKQVLTPSATGVTITSGGGGTTYNWAYQETGFNYNDPSGYTYWLVSTQSQMFLHPVLQI